MSNNKRSFVALHTVILHDPDVGQEVYKAGTVIRGLTDAKEIARLLKKRAIREVNAGEVKGNTAPLVPGVDNDTLVGDTEDHSDGVPDPMQAREGDGFEGEKPAEGSELTVAELKEWLTENNIEFPATAKKAELAALYDANTAK